MEAAWEFSGNMLCGSQKATSRVDSLPPHPRVETHTLIPAKEVECQLPAPKVCSDRIQMFSLGSSQHRCAQPA